MRSGKSVLFGIETSYGPVTYLDFSLAFILGSGKNQVPPRNRYLPFIAVRRLLQKGEISFKDLLNELDISERTGRSILRRLLRLYEASGKNFFQEEVNPKDDNPKLKLNEDVKDYWLRVKEASLSIIDRVFNSSEHPLMVRDDSWLTVLDPMQSMLCSFTF